MADVTIKGSVGEKPKPPPNKIHNDKNDVKVVQTLLNKAFGKTLIPASAMGKCGTGTARAILDFQKQWGNTKPDATVWPKPGKTLRLLNAMSQKWVLGIDSNMKRTKKFYDIGYKNDLRSSDQLPKSYQVRLEFSHLGKKKSMDVTNLDKKNIIATDDNLKTLLKVIDDLKAYPTGTSTLEIECKLVVEHSGNVVMTSDPKKLKCPVKPYTGNLGADLLVESNVDTFTYPGNGHGRYFYKIGNSYYFYSGGYMETDPANRGFDCTTYVGQVFDLDGVAGEMNQTGPTMATELGATSAVSWAGSDLEEKKGSVIKDFFETNNTGSYFMWRLKNNAGHMFIVRNGTFYEFTTGGFDSNSADKYPRYGSHKWTVRKLPADKQL